MLGLVHDMVGSRFAEIARRPDAPFLRASAGGETLGRDVEAFTVSARVNDGGIEKGLTALVSRKSPGSGSSDSARPSSIGPSATPWPRYERAYNERDKAQSGGHASELLRHFLSGEAVPGIDASSQLAAPLPADDHRRRGRARSRASSSATTNRVVLASSPEKAGLAPVTRGGAARRRCAPAARRRSTAWRDEIGRP